MRRVFPTLCSVGFALWFTPLLANLDQVTFEQVNNLIINTYAPVVKHEYQAVLELKQLWQGFGGAFKVDSTQKPIGEKRFVITLTGEIPHNTHMNADGYAIVACHEIGHVVGGAPYQKRKLTRWSSVEGQADYYATNVCMWRYVENSPEIKPVVEPEHLSLCEIFYGDSDKDLAGCLRIMSGISAFKNYFNSTNRQALVSFSKYDESVVKKTLEKYPSNQCRLDTMIAGLLKLDRPRCWHKKTGTKPGFSK